MNRVLASTIFASLIASAHAHPKPAPPAIKLEAVTQVTLKKTSEMVKVRVLRELPATTIKSSASPAESRWGKYGTLLATLVVMCAIALRRRRLERP